MGAVAVICLNNCNNSHVVLTQIRNEILTCILNKLSKTFIGSYVVVGILCSIFFCYCRQKTLNLKEDIVGDKGWWLDFDNKKKGGL